VYAPASMPPGVYPQQQKSRIAFILLGIFFGAFGVHNFYAGYHGRAIGQLCLTLCSFFLLSLATVVWAIIEICVVDRDARHLPMI
jgi:TM2 domain-containing membrane protein YozV